MFLFLREAIHEIPGIPPPEMRRAQKDKWTLEEIFFVFFREFWIVLFYYVCACDCTKARKDFDVYRVSSMGEKIFLIQNAFIKVIFVILFGWHDKRVFYKEIVIKYFLLITQ